MKALRTGVLAGLLLLMAGCGSHTENDYVPQFGQTPAEARAEFIFAALPVQNPKHLFEAYSPLIDYLNAHIRNARLKLQASRSFADFEKNLEARSYHFALPNPYETIKAINHGYQVFGKMGDDETFRGVILVRRDSKIHSIDDLRGKTISFPAPTALAAALMPQYLIHSQGIDINHDVKLLYSGSHESSIMNVYLKNADAGAVWLPPWQEFIRKQPAIAAQLEVRWQTGTLPNNGLVARNDVPAALTEQIRQALLSLDHTDEGKAILARLGTSRFEAADNDTYQPVRAFLRKFSQEVRPIETGDR